MKGLLFACSELVYRVTGERLLPAAEVEDMLAAAHELQITALPLEFLRSSEFAGLSPHATKMLFSLIAQVGPGGEGNSRVMATDKVLKPLGWTSASTTACALRELLGSDMARCVEHGGGRKQKLYCLTMLKGCGEHFGAWRRGLSATGQTPIKWMGVRVGKKTELLDQQA